MTKDRATTNHHSSEFNPNRREGSVKRCPQPETSIEDRPLVTRILDLESESYSGNWNVVKAIDGFALDLKIHAGGWSFFFMAEKAKATVFGSPAAKSIQKALKRIVLKVRKQDFNCLEVTKMVENRFLRVPYITVCTHPRHISKDAG